MLSIVVLVFVFFSAISPLCFTWKASCCFHVVPAGTRISHTQQVKWNMLCAGLLSVKYKFIKKFWRLNKRVKRTNQRMERIQANGKHKKDDANDCVGGGDGDVAASRSSFPVFFIRRWQLSFVERIGLNKCVLFAFGSWVVRLYLHRVPLSPRTATHRKWQWFELFFSFYRPAIFFSHDKSNGARTKATIDLITILRVDGRIVKSTFPLF